MKTRATVAALFALLVLSCGAAPTTAPSDDADAKYTAMLDKRVDAIVNPLNIDDAAKKTKVHDLIVAQYRALRDWQDANQAALKDKSTTPEQKQAIVATRQPLHDKFVAALGAELTPEQVEQVKDKMTYNKVEVTYRAYTQFVPTLTDTQKAKILEYLKQAREEGMDGVSQQEKDAIFKKYKGKIANYLSGEGIDIKKATKDYMDEQKAGKKPATEPV